MKEKELVKKIKEMTEVKQTSFLRKSFIHVNLATRKFKELWRDWWGGEVPPRLEVDMILVFEEDGKAFLSGVEVKYFRGEIEKFYYGLEQTLAYSLFGFDSLLLWHIFSEEMKNEVIDGYAKSVGEIIEGLSLPIVYFATKIDEDMKFEFFSPRQFYSSQKLDIVSVLGRMKEKCKEASNPLLKNDEVRKRKRVLKTILRIPV